LTIKVEFNSWNLFLGAEAADQLMSLTPFQMKSLLYYILTGKEFGVKFSELLLETLKDPEKTARKN